MEELFTKVEPFRVEAFCDCGGELEQKGFYYPTDPPMYPHACKDCGKTEILDNTYPRIVYR